MYWIDESTGDHPKIHTIITYDDVLSGVFTPVNKDNTEHALYYTKTLGMY